MKHRWPSVLFAAAAMAGTLLGFSQPTEKQVPGAVKPADKKITIALLPKKRGVPYFTSCARGADDAAKELGDVDLTYDGPTDGAPEKAASMVDRWALRGTSVIAVSPNDPEVVGHAMKQARGK